MPPAKYKVTYIEDGGKAHTVEVTEGWSLMEGAVKHLVPGIDADCGGACACATCHVYITDGWFDKLPKPSDAEIDMLDMALAVEPGSSRLSCQVICSNETDGIKVTVAPE